MTTLIDITPDDILKLDDGSLRELVARLCEAEIVHAGNSASAVTWGGDQRATDGGIDVRVSLPPSAKISGFVPRQKTVFQVKAEDFPAAKIKREMAPGGKLRTSIAELAKSRGAYIIVSSKGSVSDTSLSSRKAAMANTAKIKNKRALLVDFYDRRRIASWVERHPTIGVWVRQRAGRPISGWRPYESWAYKEYDLVADYVLDDHVKVFTPTSESGTDILVAIDQMRRELAAPKTSVRIVGLSGVGKTRLVQALFDDRIATQNPALDRRAVLYADVGDEPSPMPLALVGNLLDRGDRCTVIVDNCGAELHQRLTEKIARPNSLLSVVTLEYDIRDDIPEGTICYRLEASSEKLIETIVKRRYPSLSAPDVESIARFSGGNARVALALADTSARGGELAKLEDNQLFRRLFEQTNSADTSLLAAAEACSLAYSFHGENLESDEAELPILSLLANQTPDQLYRHVNELKRRGLIQTRGPWRAVLPHAIANRLAQQALQSLPRQTVLTAFIDKGNARLARSFSRRLGHLHNEAAARVIVSEWLSPTGLLGDVATLDSTKRAMLANVAAVDPPTALAAINRASKDQVFVSTGNPQRGHMIRLIRSIAYDPDCFRSAVDCLVAFGEAETEHYNHGSAREAINSLFQAALSGTEAPISMRAETIRALLNSESAARRAMGCSALDTALEATHFSSNGGFEFGARKRGYGWRPVTRTDIEAWFGSFIDLAVEFGCGFDDRGSKIRGSLGRKLRGLWTTARMLDKLDAASEQLKKADGWPEGWQGAKSTLAYDKTRMSEADYARLQEFEKKLRPADLMSSVRAHVFGNSVYDLGDDGASASSAHERNEERARRLGRKVAGDAEVLDQVLAEVTRQVDGRLWSFGLGLGESVIEPVPVLSRFRDLLAATPSTQRSIFALMGFLKSASAKHKAEIDTFLDEVLKDDVMAPYFPDLQCCAGLGGTGVERILRSLRMQVAPVTAYSAIARGRATDPLSIPQVASIISEIKAMGGGQTTALDIAHMVIHCRDGKPAGYSEELREFLIGFLSNLDWSEIDENKAYRAEEVLKFAFPEGALSADVRQVVGRIFPRDEEGYIGSERGAFLSALMEHHASDVLDEIFKPDADGRYLTAVKVLSERWDHRAAPLDAAPPQTVLAWCRQDVVRFPFIAHCCRMMTCSEDKKISWSPLALLLLQEAPNPEIVLQIFEKRVPPMSWSGSRASIIRKRAQLLDELPSQTNTITADVVAPIKKRLLDMAEREASQEHNYERARDESFE